MLVLLLVVPVVQSAAFGDANRVLPFRVIDPFLSIKGHSSMDISSDTVTTIVTSPNPLTMPQRIILDSLGGITGSLGTVTTVRVPSVSLEEIARLDFVSGVFHPRSLRPTLDVSASEIGATFVWQDVTDSRDRPVDGSGVLIGIVDTGVDLSHPDLRFPNGTSKVLFLWDQTITGKPPEGFSYGIECSWSQINAGECPEKDTYGHGTHVASIAASSGLATGKYQGIAPGAALLIVKSGAPLCGGGSWTFDENSIIDGLLYLLEKASALKMRLVVNLSLGGNIGGHDDTSPLEIALDYLNEQGVIVVVSSGNEADNQGHATGLLSHSSSARVNWGLLAEAGNAIVDVWYPNDREISATLVTPSGEPVRGPTSSGGTETSDGRVTIASSTTARGKELAIVVQAGETLKTSGWSVVLSSVDDGPSFRWDAWVDSDSCAYPAVAFSSGEGYTIDPNGTISVPATSNGAIAVGAYVSRNSWTNHLGKEVLAGAYHVGEIASFSSRGPTRDGRTKPEISAPGIFILAARSLDLPSSDDDPDQYHRVLAGTSMAAPHVAGLIALMLQYRPELTAKEVRSLLIEGAYLDNFTGLPELNKGSNVWGWGKADARTGTAFFRVSTMLPLLPSMFTANLTIDRQRRGLNGGEVMTLRFMSGDAHTFQVNGQTFTANATRYVITDRSDVFSSSGVFNPSVRIQYLLLLDSPYGVTEGQGWYDTGSYAIFVVNPLETSSGFSQILGVTYSFDHWVDEHGNKVSSGPLVMDSPRSLRAVWNSRLSDLRPFLLVGFAAALVLILGFRRRRVQRHQSTEPNESTLE